MSKRWKMAAPCANCPFSESEAGKTLAKSLRPGRLREIKRGLRSGATFTCHKTTSEVGDGSELLCAGALAYQHSVGVVSQYERICDRLDAIGQRRTRIAPTDFHDEASA